jgi:hypothetical protein
VQKSNTYRLLVRITAFLLLIGVTLPAGLHAKALVDFCLTPAEQECKMLPDHSCCPSETEVPEPISKSGHATHADCESIFLCTCHIDRAPLSDQNWTVKNKLFTGTFTVQVSIGPEFHDDQSHQAGLITDTYSTPPIFLLNSSFLN